MIKKFTAKWTLVHYFRLASLVVVIFGALVIGYSTGEQIKISIINEASKSTALYLDSFIVPNLQELETSEYPTAEHIELLRKQLTETNLGHHIVAIKVWDKNDRIVYSNTPALIGQVFPGADEFGPVWQGRVVSNISDLEDDENIEERKLYSRLLEIYVPVRKIGTHNVIAVAEFYQEVDALEAEIAAAQWQNWITVISSMAAIYLLLILFVQGAGNRIKRQETALQKQVLQLTEVVSQNNELDQRVRRASANTSALNENLLRRVGDKLHAGPIQDLSNALFQFDLASENELCQVAACNVDLLPVGKAMKSALEEICGITSGLSIPHLDRLTLPEIITSVVDEHEKRTGSNVYTKIGIIPDEVPVSVKIIFYRLIQEALNNGYRHARGAGQQVKADCQSNVLQLEISDEGPGFDVEQVAKGTERLGLAGMRERVESLGGRFSIASRINEGTKITAQLFLQSI